MVSAEESFSHTTWDMTVVSHHRGWAMQELRILLSVSKGKSKTSVVFLLDVFFTEITSMTYDNSQLCYTDFK